MSRYFPDFPLPPGFRFDPTKREILKYYVLPAIETGRLPAFVTECDVYSKEPWELFDSKVADCFWVYTPLKMISDSEGQNKKKKNPSQKKKDQEINSQSQNNIRRRAGCGCWDGRTAGKEVIDSDGKLLGRYRYFTYKKDRKDLNGDTSWVMHEYSAEGLKNAAICKIQCKPSSTKTNTAHLVVVASDGKKRKGETPTKVVNPTPQKKARTHTTVVNPTPEKKASADHDQPIPKLDDDSEDDQFLRSILLEISSSPPSLIESMATQPEENSLGQYNPNYETNEMRNVETFCNTSTSVDYNVGYGDECNNGSMVCQGFDEFDVIPTGFAHLDVDLQSFCTSFPTPFEDLISF